MLQKRKHLLATTALAVVVMAIPGVAGATSSAAPAEVEAGVYQGGSKASGIAGNNGNGVKFVAAPVPAGQWITSESIAAANGGNPAGAFYPLTTFLATAPTDATTNAAMVTTAAGVLKDVTEADIKAASAALGNLADNVAFSHASAADLKEKITAISGKLNQDGLADAYKTGTIDGNSATVATAKVFLANLKLLVKFAKHKNILTQIGTAEKPEDTLVDAALANATVDVIHANTLIMNAGKTFTAQSGRTEAKSVVINGEGTHVIGKNSANAVGGFDLGNVTTTKNGQGKLELHAAEDTVDASSKAVTKKGGTVGNIGTPGKRFADVTINATEGKAVATGGNVYADKLTLKTGVAANGNAINLGYVGAKSVILDGQGTNRIGGSADNVQGFNLGKVETTTDGKGVLHLYSAEGSKIGQIGATGKALEEVWLQEGRFALGSGEVHAKNVHLEAGTALRLDGYTKINGSLHAPAMNDATKKTGTLKDGSEYSYWTSEIIFSQKAIDAVKKNGKAVLEVEALGSFTADSGAKKLSAINPRVENTVLEGKFKSLKINTAPAALRAEDKMFVEETFGRDYGTALARIESIVSDDRTLITTTVSPRSDSEISRNFSVSTDEAKAIKAVVRSLGDDAEARAAMNVALDKKSDTGNAARQSAVSTVSQANQAINTASRAAADAVASRLASARTGTDVAGLQQSGTAAGDSILRNGAWVKAAGSTATQKSRGGVAGNSTNSYGMTIGMDNMVADDVRVGLALSTSKSDMKGKGASQTKTDVTSYQVALYGSYEPEGYFVEGQLAYAQNSVKTSRQITIGGLDRTAKGKYNANQYSASVAAGSPLHRGAVTLTPKAGLSYTYTDPSKYTETGAGAFNMTVDPSATSVLEGSLGGSLAYEHKTLRGSVVRPELRAAALYDFIGDDATSTGKYSGDTTLFNTSGLKRSRFGGTIGAGLGYTTADGVWEVRADYDAEMRSGYVGHNGMLTGRVNF